MGLRPRSTLESLGFVEEERDGWVSVKWEFPTGTFTLPGSKRDKRGDKPSFIFLF